MYAAMASSIRQSQLSRLILETPLDRYFVNILYLVGWGAHRILSKYFKTENSEFAHTRLAPACSKAPRSKLYIIKGHISRSAPCGIANSKHGQGNLEFLYQCKVEQIHTGWVKKNWDLKKYQIAQTHSILKLKSILKPPEKMTWSGEKHAQD